jgi:hypothetical protein
MCAGSSIRRGLPSRLTLGLLAKKPLTVALQLNRPFADTATMQIEAGITATSAERFPLIANRRPQSHAALGIAAHVTHGRFDKFSHQMSFVWK